MKNNRTHPCSVPRLLWGCVLGVIVFGCLGCDTPVASPPPSTASHPALDSACRDCSYDVLAVFPHDPSAFTQGLLYEEGRLYESTGLVGESSLRRVNLETGTVEHHIDVAPPNFAEGLARVGDRLIQLTWQNNVAFIYDFNTFALLGSVEYTGEGWGLTYDGTHLIRSDGSATLYFHDPTTFTVEKTITVRDADGTAVYRLNELEYVRGEILANVWQTDRIAIIQPDTGRVRGWIDLRGLLPVTDRTFNTDVLNGIAYDPEGDRLFVTGKRWKKLFQIRVRPARR